MAAPVMQLLGYAGKGDTRVAIYGNLDQLKRQLRRTSDIGVPRAMTRAINRTGNKTRTMLLRRISRGHNLQAKFVKSHVSTRQATYSRMTYRLIANGSRIPISKVKTFGGFSAQKQLGVRINTGNGTRLIKGAFVQRMASGHIGVYVLKGHRRVKKISKQTGQPYLSELAIRELTMPSIPHLLTNKRTALRGWAYFEKQYPAIFAKQLQFEIDKAQGLA